MNLKWKLAASCLVGAVASVCLTTAAHAAAPQPRGQATAITDPAGHLFLFQTDNATGHVWFSRNDTGTSGFTGWTDLQGVNAGTTVGAAIDSQGLVVLFVRGMTNKIYYNPENNNGSRTFTGWNLVPGSTTFTADPVATLNQVNGLEIFAANGNSVYHIWQSSPTGAFISSWASLGAPSVGMNPGSGSDLSAGLTPSNQLVVTAGSSYRAVVNGAWTAWRRTSTSVPFDHVALRRTQDRLYAVGVDYNCNMYCIVYAAVFGDAQGALQAPYRPDGSPHKAYLGPPATGGYGTGLDIAITTGAYNDFTYAGACSNCGPRWYNMGSQPQGTTVRPTIGEMEGPQITFVINSSATGTYYQIFWRDTVTPSGGWVRIS